MKLRYEISSSWNDLSLHILDTQGFYDLDLYQSAYIEPGNMKHH